MSQRWLLITLLAAVACAGCATPAQPTGDTEATSATVVGDDVIVPSEAPMSSTAARSAAPTADAGDGTTTATVTCDPMARPPLQTGSHLIGDQAPPVQYSSTPPTSGWHSSGHVHVSVRGTRNPLTEPEQVSVLEVGGIVVTHGRLDPDDRRRLAQCVRNRYDGMVAVTPYRELSRGEVTFTSWGVLKRCDGVDLAALERFVDRFGPDGPVEPGH